MIVTVTHLYFIVIYQACNYRNDSESQTFGCALWSVLLLKLLWITSIYAWPIKRVMIEIIVNHKHLCVTYRACYNWNYCESQAFMHDLSSVLLLKLLGIMITCMWPIEPVTIEIIENHDHLVVTYWACDYWNHSESRILDCYGHTHYCMILNYWCKISQK